MMLLFMFLHVFMKVDDDKSHEVEDDENVLEAGISEVENFGGEFLHFYEKDNVLRGFINIFLRF